MPDLKEKLDETKRQLEEEARRARNGAAGQRRRLQNRMEESRLEGSPGEKIGERARAIGKKVSDETHSLEQKSEHAQHRLSADLDDLSVKVAESAGKLDRKKSEAESE